MGSTVPDVLLFNPMETAWMNTHAAMLDSRVWDILEGRLDDQRFHKINQVYSDAINDLTNARIEFLVGDRYYMNQMTAKKGKLLLRNFSFGTVVLPPLDILTLGTARKIVDFAKSGGRVYSLGDLPLASAENGMNDPKMKKLMDALRNSATFSAVGETLKPEIEKGAPGLTSQVTFTSGAFPMLQLHRRIDGKDFFWLVNNQEIARPCELSINGVRGAASVWDCETGEIRPVGSESSESGSLVSLIFKPLEAFWLVFDPEMPVNPRSAPDGFEITQVVEGNWKVTFDPGIQPVMEFPSVPPAAFAAGVEKPLTDWKAWGFEKFSGLLDYNKTINVDRVEKQVLIDLGKVCHVAEIWVNGKNMGSRMWGPYLFDISSAVNPGANEIRVRVANLINNSYGDIQESGLLGPVSLLQTAVNQFNDAHGKK